MATKTATIDYEKMSDSEIAALVKQPVSSSTRSIFIKRLKEGGLASFGSKPAAAPTSPQDAVPRRPRGARARAEAAEAAAAGVQRSELVDDEPVGGHVKRRRNESSLPPVAEARPQYFEPPRAQMDECRHCGDTVRFGDPSHECLRHLHARVSQLEQRVDRSLARQEELDRYVQELNSGVSERLLSQEREVGSVLESCMRIDGAGVALTKEMHTVHADLSSRVVQLERQIASAEQLLAHLRNPASGSSRPLYSTSIHEPSPLRTDPASASYSGYARSAHDRPAAYPTQPPSAPAGSGSRYALPVTVECAQCGDSFSERDNAHQACAHHPGDLILPRAIAAGTLASAVTMIYSCCQRPSGSKPCALGFHVAKS